MERENKGRKDLDKRKSVRKVKVNTSFDLNILTYQVCWSAKI